MYGSKRGKSLNARDNNLAANSLIIEKGQMSIEHKNLQSVQTNKIFSPDSKAEPVSIYGETTADFT